jgi:hypothetical protein
MSFEKSIHFDFGKPMLVPDGTPRRLYANLFAFKPAQLLHYGDLALKHPFAAIAKGLFDNSDIPHEACKP